MKYEISNEYLKVKADTEGAILWSVTDKDGFEYIWQGVPDFLDHGNSLERADCGNVFLILARKAGYVI